MFNVDLQNYVIDELHLMLRITDRLEEGLIYSIIDNDEVNFTQTAFELHSFST